MGFHVQFYIFEKRVNSTARPVGQEHFALLGNLKEGCGIHNPTIMFSLPADYQDVGNYNYAYIKLWRRFYYIKEWYWEEGAWNCQFVEDPLASWRDEIGALEEYVVRAAQTYDGSIIDMYYPCKAISTKQGEQVAIDFSYSFDHGSYVIGCIGGSSSIDAQQGAVTYYRLNPVQMSAFLYSLTEESDWLKIPLAQKTEVYGTLGDMDLDITELKSLSKDMEKGYLNPIQYIVSCKWYPFEVPVKKNVGYIALGYYLNPTPASIVDDNPKVMTTSIRIPKHPQASSRGSYLNIAPFSRYTLYLGNLGVYPLDSITLAQMGSLDITLTVDCFTGICTLCVDTPSHTFGFRVLQTTCPLAVDIAVAQISRDIVGGVATAVNSIANTVSSGNVLGGIVSGISGIANSVNALQPQLSVSGSNGTISAFRLPWQITSEHLLVVDEDLEHRGRPLCQRRRISELGGYMMIADADVSLPATDEELSQIKSYMEGGFYWQ